MRIIVFIIFILIGTQAHAQIATGKLRDSITGRILVHAKVQSSKAVGFTDHQGNFRIAVNQTDSLSFFLLDYQTRKLKFFMNADEKSLGIIGLTPNSISIEEVRVEGKKTKTDSNNFKVNLGIPKTPKYRQVVLGRADMSGNPRGFLANGSTARLFTIDLLAVKRMLFKKKEIIPLEEQLEADEYTIQYIDMKFSRDLIEEITGLKGEQVFIFQNTYRPTYPEFSNMSEYEMRNYIKKSFEEFQKANKK